MESWMIGGMVGGLVAGLIIVGVVLYVIFQSEKKRQKRMESAALQFGFKFEPGGGSIGESEFAELPLLKKGVGILKPNPKEQCRNVLHGTRGSTDFAIFDFKYSTGGQGAGFKVTVAAFRSKDSPIPAFELRPRARLDMHIAGKDESIRFEDDPVFSKDYFLTGKDTSAIRALFSPEVLQVLADTDKKWAVEARGKALIVYLNRRRADPEKLSDFIETAGRIAETLLQGDHL